MVTYNSLNKKSYLMENLKYLKYSTYLIGHGLLDLE